MAQLYKSTQKFQKTVSYMLEHYEFLAPDSESSKLFYKLDTLRGDQTKRQFFLQENGMEVLRGGLVRLMAIWEAFIVDVLQEAFIDFIWPTESVDDLEKKWENRKNGKTNRVKKALDQALKYRCETDSGDCPVLVHLTERNLPGYWKEILKRYHAFPILRSHFNPVFGSGPNSIDSLVKKLFLVEANITELCAAEKKVTFFVVPVNPTEIRIERFGLICCSLLYQGLRSVFAHDDPNNSVKEEVLDDFDSRLAGKLKKEKIDVLKISDYPEAAKVLGVEDARAEEDLQSQNHYKYKPAEMLLTLRKNLEHFSKRPYVSFQTWKNACYFLKTAAEWFDEAIKEMVDKLPAIN